VTRNPKQISGPVPDIGHYDFVCLPLDTPHCVCGVTGPNCEVVSGVETPRNLYDFKGYGGASIRLYTSGTLCPCESRTSASRKQLIICSGIFHFPWLKNSPKSEVHSKLKSLTLIGPLFSGQAKRWPPSGSNLSTTMIPSPSRRLLSSSYSSASRSSSEINIRVRKQIARSNGL